MSDTVVIRAVAAVDDDGTHSAWADAWRGERMLYNDPVTSELSEGEAVLTARGRAHALRAAFEDLGLECRVEPRFKTASDQEAE